MVYNNNRVYSIMLCIVNMFSTGFHGIEDKSIKFFEKNHILF